MNASRTRRVRSFVRSSAALAARRPATAIQKKVYCMINTEAKRCFATHDEDIDYFKDSTTLYIYILKIALRCIYIKDSSTLYIY